MDFRVKQLKSYHLVGKLATDRNVINNKIRAESFSIHKMKEQEQEKLQKAKEENKYIWSRYIDEGEVENAESSADDGDIEKTSDADDDTSSLTDKAFNLFRRNKKEED